MPLGGSSRVAGGPTQSSSVSGVYFQGDGYPQVQMNSNLSSSFGNSSVSGKGCSSLYPTSGDMNRTGLNSASNSGPSVGASSLVTDANSALSGGPQLQRSASFNAESYMRMPASPMSFSSNNVSVSGNSVLDGPSMVQQSSHQDQNPQQGQKRQQGASSASSRIGQVSGPTGSQVLNSSNQAAQYMSQMQKKPRLDINPEEIIHQQYVQQVLQRQNGIQLQGPNHQIQALIQQPRHLQRQQPQQVLPSVAQMQRAQLQQHHLRQQVHQQSLQSLSGLGRPYENGVCGRRLMQYLYHQRQRPEDNSITYWRKFTEEYFAPRAKKRWCLSLYDNVGQHALGVFPQATMDAWQCDICGAKSGRGFEATRETLPRLSKVEYESGVKDEILYLDLPRESQLPSGIIILEYGRAVQESAYEQLRVMREGRLRIIFSPELKILSWEFCARRHDELLSRRLITPQVNQLLQVAQKYQNAVTESGSDGVSTHDLQSNWNMFLTAGRQLARNLELPLLNDLGFSKRYVRCLQIAEVVNSMKDLMHFSRERNIGPIESLKTYPRRSKFQMQNMQEAGQQGAAEGLPTDRNPPNNIMSQHPSLSSQINNNNHMVGRGSLNTPAQTALNSFYQSILRQNAMNSNPNAHQQEGSSFNNSSPFRGAVSSTQGTMQNGPVNGMSNPQFHHQQQQQQQPVNGNLASQQNHPQSSPGNQTTGNDAIQKLLHSMMNNSGDGSKQQQSLPAGEGTSNLPNTTPSGAQPVNTSTTDIGGSNVGPGDNGSNNGSADTTKETPDGNSNSNSNVNTFAGAGGDDNFSLDTSDFADLHLPEIEGDISDAFPEWDM